MVKFLFLAYLFIYTVGLRAQVKLNFVINKNLLIVHSLYNPSDNNLSFQKIKTNHPKAIQVLEKYNNGSNYKIWLIEDDINKEIQESLSEIKKSPYFKDFYDETYQFLNEVKKEWISNRAHSHLLMTEITKLDFNKNLTVYITHPLTGKAGQYLGKNRIHWGVRSNEPNYATVYLWHEVLHSYIERTLLGHVSIELATDYELARRLNPSTTEGFEGHKELKTKRKQLIDNGSWEDYLSNRSKNIIDFSEL